MAWQQGAEIMFGQRKPISYQQINDVSAAIGFTSPPATAKLAIIQAVDQNIRWRDDGTAASATVGMQLVASNSIVYVGDIGALSFFEEAGGAEINASFYE